MVDASHFAAWGLLSDGYDIRTVRELLGNNDVRTAMIYTHFLGRGDHGVLSPAYGLTKRPDERYTHSGCHPSAASPKPSRRS